MSSFVGDIRAVVFDMDGVLIDAADWHFEALNRALGLFGHSISRHEHLVTFNGLPTTKKLEMLSLEKNLPRDLHDFLNALKQRYTMELVHSRCKPTFQHEHALASLKADGYLLAVASNSIRSTIDTMMQRSALAKYLDVIVSNEDVQHPKPSPEMYLTAAARLGVDPRECLAVEDNQNGVRSAMESGAHVMEVADPAAVTYQAIVRHIRMAARK